MSSVNKSKYLNHISQMCVAQILKQIGIDKCSKNAIQLMTDLFARYMRHLGESISRSASTLTFRSSPSFSLTDGIFVLEEELGPYNQGSSQWYDLCLFLERQIQFSKLITKSIEDRNICILNLLFGIPVKLDLEGKDVLLCPFPGFKAASLHESNEEDNFTFLPPFPLPLQLNIAPNQNSTFVVVDKTENTLETKKVPLPVKPINNPVEEKKSNFYWKESDLSNVFKNNSHLSERPSIELNSSFDFCTFMEDFIKSNDRIESMEINFLPKTLDLIPFVERNLLRKPLWISGEGQVLHFFANSNTKELPQLQPIILSTSIPPTPVVLNIDENCVESINPTDSNPVTDEPAVSCEMMDVDCNVNNSKMSENLSAASQTIKLSIKPILTSNP